MDWRKGVGIMVFQNVKVKRIFIIFGAEMDWRKGVEWGIMISRQTEMP